MRRTSSALTSAGSLTAGASFGGGSGFGREASDVDVNRATSPKPLFRLNEGSETLLLALKNDGRPPRKTWDANAALSQSSSNLFRLKAVKLPEISSKQTSGTEYSKNRVLDHLKSQLQIGPPVGGPFSPTGSGTLGATAAERRSAAASPPAPRPPPRRLDELS